MVRDYTRYLGLLSMMMIIIMRRRRRDFISFTQAMNANYIFHQIANL